MDIEKNLFEGVWKQHYKEGNVVQEHYLSKDEVRLFNKGNTTIVEGVIDTTDQEVELCAINERCMVLLRGSEVFVYFRIS